MRGNEPVKISLCASGCQAHFTATESDKDQKTKRFSNPVFDFRCPICGTCDGGIKAIVEGSKFRESHILKILSYGTK
jgi:hypothetical protein